MTDTPEPENETPAEQAIVGTTDDGKTFVLTPRGMALDGGEGDEATPSITDLVAQPDKVMRIATMIGKLLEEVKAAPLDESSRRRLAEVYRSSISELRHALAPELGDELERITAPFTCDDIPSDSELRISHAQLVGWLEGLFHGIQTALLAQQMSARGQLEQIRKALPHGQPSIPQDGTQRPNGMYL